MNGRNIVTVNGDSFEYLLTGNDGPSVIFINGFRLPLTSWEKLYPEVEMWGRIFTYNRLGVGKSSKASTIQTGDIVVNSLRKTLAKLAVSPPYVLVAHSIGGLFANLYARMKPEEISSVVFIDAAHPDEKAQQNQFQPPFLLRKINEGTKSIERIFDKYRYSEDEYIAKTIQQIREAGEFPRIPIAVISGTKKMPFVPQASFDIHLQWQKELLALSPTSYHYVAQNSGHFPHITEPEVVLTAIKDILSGNVRSE